MMIMKYLTDIGVEYYCEEYKSLVV